MSLYHYTCDHGRAGIGDVGTLLSLHQLTTAERIAQMPAWSQQLAGMIWMTDMAVPDHDGLGLTRRTIACDRTAFRYRVTDYVPVKYVAIRRDLSQRLRNELERAPGALPMHWWVAYTPVPVVYDPVLAMVGAP